MDARRLEGLYEEKLCMLLAALIDQDGAQTLVPPYAPESGFWFGGGNVGRDADGVLWLVGRYRNAGDSRTGIKAGERGLELALFSSNNGGCSFEKRQSWSKAELSTESAKVLSIEGSALHRRADGRWELLVSTEKETAYPDEVAEFQKPGTGIWTTDVFTGSSPADLDVSSIAPVIAENPEPGYLHVKDPVVFDGPGGETVLVLCNHPFSWTSSNSGYAVRDLGDARFTTESWQLVARGPAWDVAGTRVTSRMPLPRLGVFDDLPPVAVYFYDGLECVRELEQNPTGVRRPRGFSCEELGGACYGRLDDFPTMTRLSRNQPLFVSPHGTGCSRYVDVLVDEDGILATWQQAQADGSQPLVGHRLDMGRVAEILA